MNRPEFLPTLAIAACALVLCASTFAAEPEATASAASASNTPDLKIREISATVFAIGDIRFDKAARSVTIPATASMRDGLAEYLLTTESGKAYESILQTKAEPLHIHAAMLLLGATASGTTDAAAPEHIDSASLAHAPKLTGDDVEIRVTWKENGTDRDLPGEALAENTKRRPRKNPAAATASTPWIYNGSRLFQGKLVVQLEGSIIALVTDPSALVNNPRPGHDDDHIWSPRKENLPPEGTPVEVTIRLLPKTGAKKGRPATP